VGRAPTVSKMVSLGCSEFLFCLRGELFRLPRMIALAVCCPFVFVITAPPRFSLAWPGPGWQQRMNPMGFLMNREIGCYPKRRLA
jgi:hypothetical protein